jgi:radical SAM protein with 4Fe4S-binding SPASM domain
MTSATARFWDSFAQAIFDERFYRLAHPDVDEAIRAGNVVSGYRHYCEHGRDEERPARTKLWPGIALPKALGAWSSKATFQESLARANFDERYYRLAHPDVDIAIRAGNVVSGYRHYCEHGRDEERSVRTRFSPSALWPRTVVVFKGVDDYLSGLNLKLIDREAASYRLDVFRVGAKGAERVVRVEFDRDVEIYDGLGYMMWTPIQDSKDRIFVARIARLDDGRKSAGFADFLLAESDAQVFSTPTSKFTTPPLLGLSPVTQCNLNCIHCISRPTRKKVREFSEEMWSQFETLAASNRVLEAAADYSGDILYAQGKSKSWLDRMIALDVNLNVVTHANNLTSELAEKLIQSRLVKINFSIDSFDPEDYPRIRKGALPLDQVLHNIATFMRMRNERRPSLSASLSLVLMRRNLTSMIPAIDFAAAHGIEVVNCGHLIIFTPDMMEESVLLDQSRYRLAYEAAREHARKKGVVLGAPLPLSKFTPRKGHQPCVAPWGSVVVTGDGDVRACCIPDTVVGNLNEESLEQIWNGERMRAFRAAVNTPNPPGPCGECGIYRHENNFDSYTPGLNRSEREAFVARVLAQA